MVLQRVSSVDANYPVEFKNLDIRNLMVYSSTGDRLGEVHEVLVDQQGHYYLGLDAASLQPAQTLLIPLEQCQVNPQARRIDLQGGRSQLSSLPTYNPADVVKQNVTNGSAQVSPPVYREALLEDSFPLEASLPLEADILYGQRQVITSVQTSEVAPPSMATPLESDRRFNPPAYSETINTNAPVDISHPVTPVSRAEIRQEERIPLLEERVLVNSQRSKIGEVIVRKEIETRMVQVPIRREKLIVEQVSPDHKQLASIDLGQVKPELEASDVVLGESMMAERQALPLEIAVWFLNEAVKQPQFKTTAVQLRFEDKQLQETYQRWLVRYQAGTDPAH